MKNERIESHGLQLWAAPEMAEIMVLAHAAVLVDHRHFNPVDAAATNLALENAHRIELRLETSDEVVRFARFRGHFGEEAVVKAARRAERKKSKAAVSATARSSALKRREGRVLAAKRVARRRFATSRPFAGLKALMSI